MKLVFLALCVGISGANILNSAGYGGYSTLLAMAFLLIALFGRRGWNSFK